MALEKNDSVEFYSQTDLVKRFHFTIALAVALTGCTCVAPLQAPRTASKTIAGSEKAVAAKKKSIRHRATADTRKKIVAPPVAVKTPPQQDEKSNAEIEKFHCDEERDPATLPVR